jgi:hypothetical protein
MNKNTEHVTESEEMEEAAEIFFDALADIADIVENKDFNRTNWNKIKIILERAGL